MLCGMNSIIRNGNTVRGPWMLSRMGFPPFGPSTCKVGYDSLVSAPWDEESTSIHSHMAIAQGTLFLSPGTCHRHLREDPSLPWGQAYDPDIHRWLYLSCYQPSIKDTESSQCFPGPSSHCFRAFSSRIYQSRGSCEMCMPWAASKSISPYRMKWSLVPRQCHLEGGPLGWKQRTSSFKYMKEGVQAWPHVLCNINDIGNRCQLQGLVEKETNLGWRIKKAFRKDCWIGSRR